MDFSHIVNTALMAKTMAKIKELASLDEALVDPTWKDAMQADYDNILKNQTWELVDCPPIKKVIGTKWV